MTQRASPCTTRLEPRSGDAPEGEEALRQAVAEAVGRLATRPCQACDVCRLLCPDLAITRAEGTGEIRIDLGYCKGCGICAAFCPRGAIRREDALQEGGGPEGSPAGNPSPPPEEPGEAAPRPSPQDPEADPCEGFRPAGALPGRVFVPKPSGRRKHPCPDCFSCQWCADSRCAACRGGGCGQATKR